MPPVTMPCFFPGKTAAVAALLGATLPLSAREWRDVADRKLEGEMLGIERDSAVVVLPNKQRVLLPVANLSADYCRIS